MNNELNESTSVPSVTEITDKTEEKEYIFYYTFNELKYYSGICFALGISLAIGSTGLLLSLLNMFFGTHLK